MKVLPYILGVFLFILFIGIAYIGKVTPETHVYLGRQVPKRFINEIKSLGLLNDNEKIKYFYSDGFLDIKTGFYFVSDQKLVVYSSEWEEPETIINFDEIAKLDIEFDDSFFDDSIIYLETKDGMEVTFPVSSEKKRDKAFFEFLLQMSGIDQNINNFDSLIDSSESIIIEDTIVKQ